MRRTLAFASALMLVPTATAGAACSDANLKLKRGTAAKVENAIICLVNAERTKRKLDPLRLSTKLRLAARRHTADMVRRDYFDHVSPGGEGPEDRIRKAGFRFSNWAENIATGGTTARETMKQWMTSTGHRRNILGPNSHIGLGAKVATSRNDKLFRVAYTQVFATPA